MGPNNTVSIKVGMQGRVIIGPEGAGSNSIDVPLRFAVVRETIDSKVITTKLDRVAVTVPPDEGNVLFSHVTEGLEFPMPRGGEIGQLRRLYRVRSGERAGDREEAQAETEAGPQDRPELTLQIGITSRAARRPCS